jgi:hypothetical protein
MRSQQSYTRSGTNVESRWPFHPLDNSNWLDHEIRLDNPHASLAFANLANTKLFNLSASATLTNLDHFISQERLL